MTREEAIIELSMAVERLRVSAHIDKNRVTAFVMAEQALQEPPREHARWLVVSKTRAMCTKCLSRRNIETQFCWQYCPRCGAKMDGEEE